MYNCIWKKSNRTLRPCAWRPKGLGVPPSAERYGGFIALDLISRVLYNLKYKHEPKTTPLGGWPEGIGSPTLYRKARWFFYCLLQLMKQLTLLEFLLQLLIVRTTLMRLSYQPRNGVSQTNNSAGLILLTDYFTRFNT